MYDVRFYSINLDIRQLNLNDETNIFFLWKENPVWIQDHHSIAYYVRKILFHTSVHPLQLVLLNFAKLPIHKRIYIIKKKDLKEGISGLICLN